MLNEKGYKNLLSNICTFEKLNDIERNKAENKLNLKLKDISELRENIEENVKEYTDISYFFVVYFIAISSKDDSYEFEELKNGNFFNEIEKIICDNCVKSDLNYFANKDEYVKKYKNDYELLIKGLKNTPKLQKSYLDEVIEKFWNIFKE